MGIHIGDIGDLMKIIGSQTKKKVVEKKIPIKEEWKKEIEKARNLGKILDAGVKKLNVMKKKFWNTVELDTGIFDKTMELDYDNNQILVLKDSSDDDDDDNNKKDDEDEDDDES